MTEQIYQKKWEDERLTKRLKAVTVAREVAMAVLERASSPRWPTIMVETTCTKYWDRTTTTIGPAMHPNLFTSSKNENHVRLVDPFLCSTWSLPLGNNNPSSMFVSSAPGVGTLKLIWSYTTNIWQNRNSRNYVKEKVFPYNTESILAALKLTKKTRLNFWCRNLSPFIF